MRGQRYWSAPESFAGRAQSAGEAAPLLVTVNFAPLMTAPEGSVTVPFSDAPPTSDCANTTELREIARESLLQRFSSIVFDFVRSFLATDWPSICTNRCMGTIPAPKQVKSTRGTIEIHPYVQGRLRALPRHDESAGILLGTSENGVTRVTGFKRVTPSGLRQAAFDAGPALAGFYRLQTSNAPTLCPAEEELWRQIEPEGRSLFLLVKAVSGGVEGTVLTREDSGPPAAERISLDGEFMERRRAVVPQDVLRIRLSRPTVPRRIVLYTALGLVLATGFFLGWPSKPLPVLSLAVESRAGELTAIWEQKNAPDAQLQLATLSVMDGKDEQSMDLTRNYTPRGRITVRPRSRDVVFTLRVQYAGEPVLSRGATYLGFVPVPIAGPTARPDAELSTLRKENKELREAIAALKKHIF